MPDIQMGVLEGRFAYTVLKRLSDKGIFENTKGTVNALMTREEFYSKLSRRYVEESFEGSLPAFVAAFTSGKRLSEEDAEKIRRMIDAAED